MTRDPFWISVAGVAAMVLIIAATISDCRTQQRCESLGGRVENYDCTTSFMTTSCGSDCWTTTPFTTCKWRCVGAPAESP